MEQNLICKKCGRKYATRMSTKRCLKLDVLGRKCDSCKQEARDNVSRMLAERNRSPKMRAASSMNMRRNNPMYDRSTVDKVVETNRLAYSSGQRKSSFIDPEVRAKSAESIRKFWASERSQGLRDQSKKRMSKCNPMFDQQTMEKVMKSMAEGRSSGRIITPKGRDHWLWKGNRRFNLVVRSRLYKAWTIPVITRDQFTCILCGRTDCSLQAHHTKSLASIIESVLKREGIENIEELKETTRYSLLADLVVAEHHLEDGITVCRKCHAAVDRQYRGYEKLNPNGLSQRMAAIRKKQGSSHGESVVPSGS